MPCYREYGSGCKRRELVNAVAWHVSTTKNAVMIYLDLIEEAGEWYEWICEVATVSILVSDLAYESAF